MNSFNPPRTGRVAIHVRWRTQALPESLGHRSRWKRNVKIGTAPKQDVQGGCELCENLGRKRKVVDAEENCHRGWRPPLETKAKLCYRSPRVHLDASSMSESVERDTVIHGLYCDRGHDGKGLAGSPGERLDRAAVAAARPAHCRHAEPGWERSARWEDRTEARSARSSTWHDLRPPNISFTRPPRPYPPNPGIMSPRPPRPYPPNPVLISPRFPATLALASSPAPVIDEPTTGHTMHHRFATSLLESPLEIRAVPAPPKDMRTPTTSTHILDHAHLPASPAAHPSSLPLASLAPSRTSTFSTPHPREIPLARPGNTATLQFVPVTTPAKEVLRW